MATKVLKRQDNIVIKQLVNGDLSGVLELRWEALDRPVGISKQQLPSENDLCSDNIHVIALDGQKIVSAVRLDLLSGSGRYLVKRMATDNLYRRRGIGTDVLNKAEEIVIGFGAKYIVLYSRSNAVKFYEKLGYNLTGLIEVHYSGESFEMEKYIEKRL